MSRTFDTPSAFNAAAGDFDRLGEHLWRPIAADTIVRTAPGSGERVLDACCGDGASALPTASIVGPGGRVDAVDLSAAMIHSLQANAGGLPQLRAHCADVTSWAEDGYDLIQCVLGIFFLPDMSSGTRDLIAKARPGGRVGLTIWRSGAMEAVGRHLTEAIAAVTGTPSSQREPHLIDDISDRASFAAWLRELGLAEVEVTESSRFLPLTPTVAWLLITGSGFVGLLRGLADNEVKRVRTEFLDSLAAAGISEIDASTLIATGRRPQ